MDIAEWGYTIGYCLALGCIFTAAVISGYYLWKQSGDRDVR